jgi:hypothetical protein
LCVVYYAVDVALIVVVVDAVDMALIVVVVLVPTVHRCCWKKTLRRGQNS